MNAAMTAASPTPEQPVGTAKSLGALLAGSDLTVARAIHEHCDCDWGAVFAPCDFVTGRYRELERLRRAGEPTEDYDDDCFELQPLCELRREKGYGLAELFRSCVPILDFR